MFNELFEVNPFFKSIKQKSLDRLEKKDTDNVVSNVVYNVLFGGIFIYGLFALLFLTKLTSGMTQPYQLITILYAVCFVGGSALTLKSSNPLYSFLGYNIVILPLGPSLMCGLKDASLHRYEFELLYRLYRKLEPELIFYLLVFVIILTICSVIDASILETYTGMFFLFLSSAIIGIFGIVVYSNLFSHDEIKYFPMTVAVILLFVITVFFRKSQSYVKTVDNAVDSALDIYLKIFIFILLTIFQLFALLFSQRRPTAYDKIQSRKGDGGGFFTKKHW